MRCEYNELLIQFFYVYVFSLLFFFDLNYLDDVCKLIFDYFLFIFNIVEMLLGIIVVNMNFFINGLLLIDFVESKYIVFSK